MKKGFYIAIAFLLMSGGSLSAQHYIGVRGGWGGGSSRIYPSRETGLEWGLMSGGVSWKFYSNTCFVGAVAADLQYMERGLMYNEARNSDTSFHWKMSSIELPFIWQPHAYLFMRKMRVFLNLGVYMNYNFNARYQEKSKREGVIKDESYPFVLIQHNRLGYGLCGGFGFGILAGRFEFAVEGRYYYGFSDYWRNATKYPSNPLRSPLDNINISFAVYYRLSKEGIRVEPGKKLAEKMREREARRLLENPPPDNSLEETLIIDQEGEVHETSSPDPVSPAQEERRITTPAAAEPAVIIEGPSPNANNPADVTSPNSEPDPRDLNP